MVYKSLKIIICVYILDSNDIEVLAVYEWPTLSH